jgi:hypothetical protein
VPWKRTILADDAVGSHGGDGNEGGRCFQISGFQEADVL